MHASAGGALRSIAAAGTTRWRRTGISGVRVGVGSSADGRLTAADKGEYEIRNLNVRQ
jgi:hypothetical protein